MKTGTVKFFKKDKGFGFIIEDETKKEYFAHISECKNDIDKDDRVTFSPSSNRKGEMATDIKKM